MADGPVFIVGMMRSGTTLLRLILDSHPAIAVGPESGFMGALDATKRIPRWKYGDGWYRRFGWSEEEFDRHLHDFYDTIFTRFAASEGKRRWGEKTPFHTRHMLEMGSVFPEAQFVGIVRHPAAVAYSMTRTWNYGWEESLDAWADTNLTMIRSGEQLGSRFALLRYEDLVLQPEPSTRQLVDFLQEPWSEALLQHHEVQEGKGSERVTDGGTNSRRPVDPAYLSKWQGDLEAEEVSALERVHPLAGAFGYQPRLPLPEPWEEGDRLVLQAQEVKAIGGRVEGIEAPAGSEVRELAENLSPYELAEQLLATRDNLRRERARRSVRLADAGRRMVRSRSPRDLGQALVEIRQAVR